MRQAKPLSLVFAVPDHPWVDSADGAAVRISMTVGEGGEHAGKLAVVLEEGKGQGEGSAVTLQTRDGKLQSDLRVGANVSAASPLLANEGISSPGVKLHGSGFIVTPEEATQLGLGRDSGLEQHIREYRHGRDLTQTPRGVMVIDLFGLSAKDVRERYPDVYQRVLERVKPEREHNNRASYRENWWIFGEPRSEIRPALRNLTQYIATVATSKHRFFTFLSTAVLPDDALIAVAVPDSYHLGVLSSRLHVVWALALGGRLGVGNDSRYNKTRCFETFPFPDCTEAQASRIRDLAEQLDVRRKHRQQLHPDLTLTGIYNVIETIRRGEDLTAKDKLIHEQGLVTVIGELHDELDATVLEAYGWSDLAPALIGKPGGTTPYPHKSAEQTQAEETLLERLVQLNAERAAEEQRGIVRWLRPDFQNPQGRTAGQESLITGDGPEPAQPAAGKRPWPKPLSEQVRAVRAALTEQPAPATPQQLARAFKRAPAKRVEELLETLTALGQARKTDDDRYTS